MKDVQNPKKHKRNMHNTKKTTSVKYADDITLISWIFEKLRLSTNELHQACNKWGIKTNNYKSKVLTSHPHNVGLDDQSIENVKDFVFLWSLILGSVSDFHWKIGLASTAFGRLKRTI